MSYVVTEVFHEQLLVSGWVFSLKLLPCLIPGHEVSESVSGVVQLIVEVATAPKKIGIATKQYIYSNEFIIL